MGNNNSIENERRQEAIRIALRQADFDAEQRMQAAARYAEIERSRREERVASQRPSTARNLTSTSNTTVPRNEAVRRTSTVADTVPRTSSVDFTPSRTCTGSTTIQRTFTVNSTVPRTARGTSLATPTLNTNIPTTASTSNTMPILLPVDATVSGTSTVATTVPMNYTETATPPGTSPTTPTVNTNIPKTASTSNTIPILLPVDATVSGTSTVTTTVPMNYTETASPPGTSLTTPTVNTNIPTTASTSNTIPILLPVDATVSGTSTVTTTVPMNYTETATPPGTSLTTPTVNTNIPTTVSTSNTMPILSPVDATVSETSTVTTTVPMNYTETATPPETSLTTPIVNTNIPTTASTSNAMPILFPVDDTIPRPFAGSISVPTQASSTTSPVTAEVIIARPSTSAYENVNEQLQAAIIESNHDMIRPSAPLLSELLEREDRTQSANQSNKQKFRGKKCRDRRDRSTSVASSIGEVPSILLCGVCEGLMVGHVYFCPNEHNQMCASCCLESKPCPQCGLSFVPTDETRRNFALEEHISKMKIDSTKSQDNSQQREPRRPNSESQAPAKRNLPSCLLCELCTQLMDSHVYFCYNKHSRLCSACCQERRPCPLCQCLTIVADDTPRNFALEEQIRQMKEKDPGLSEGRGPECRRLPCDNAAVGCVLRFAPAHLETHRDDCFFRVVRCPITNGMFSFRRCEWNGTNNTLADHMRNEHREHCNMRVGSEAYLRSLDRDLSQLQVIRLGTYNFLMHVQVNTVERHVSWAVALLGTAYAARGWTFQIQIYNKEDLMRKVTLTNKCVSDAVPEQRIFDYCSQVPLSNALSYLNADNKLFYKVYIMKK